MDYTPLDFSRLTGIPLGAADPVGMARRQLAGFLADPFQTPSEVAGEAALRDYLAGTATFSNYPNAGSYYANAAQPGKGIDFFATTTAASTVRLVPTTVWPIAAAGGVGLLAWWLL